LKNPCCYSESQLQEAITLATPNYGYEKRQRELAKKKKKEEKLRSKTQRRPDDPQGDDQPADGQPSGDAAAPDQPTGAPGA
jgi:hypothetical protein